MASKNTPDPFSGALPDKAAIEAMDPSEKRALLSAIEARVARTSDTLSAMDRMAARYLMWSGGFRRADLHRMLRGQLLITAEEPACEAGDGRRHSQIHLDGPLDPVPFPRSLLRCPLQDRACLGDTTVPCQHAQEEFLTIRRSPPARIPEDRRLSEWAMARIMEGEVWPCNVLGSMAWRFCRELLDVPMDGRPPDDSDLTRQRLRQTAAELRAQIMGRQPVDPLHPLRFLLETGRLSWSELSDIIGQRLAVTDTEWLSCRDDPQRDDVWTERHYVSDEQALCPLHVRALLGDTTVPCSVALGLPPQPALQQLAHKLLPDGPEERDTVVPYWEDEDQAPGGPNDVARSLGAPCHAMGMLLARSMAELLDRLASDMDWYREDARMLDPGPEEQADNGAADEMAWSPG